MKVICDPGNFGAIITKLEGKLPNVIATGPGLPDTEEDFLRFAETWGGAHVSVLVEKPIARFGGYSAKKQIVEEFNRWREIRHFFGSFQAVEANVWRRKVFGFSELPPMVEGMGWRRFEYERARNYFPDLDWSGLLKKHTKKGRPTKSDSNFGGICAALCLLIYYEMKMEEKNG